jgi:phage-related protein
MRELTKEDVNEVNGGFWGFIIGSAISLVSYAINKHRHEEPMTIPGAVTAAGFGAITGGVGGAAVEVAGGGIAANIAWRPGFAAINAAGQAIAAEQ